MQPRNVKINKLTNSIFGEFVLASTTILHVNAGWYQDQRRGWEFCVQINISERNDWDIKARDGAGHYLARALHMLKVEFLPSELRAIENFLKDFKSQSEALTQEKLDY